MNVKTQTTPTARFQAHKRVMTHSNQFFATMYAFFKLERLSKATHVNRFALKATLYLKAQQASLAELQVFKTQLAVGFA